MKIDNFAVLDGKSTSITKGIIKYIPDHQSMTDGKTQTKETLAANIRADKVFYQGVFSLKFKAKSAKTGILLMHHDDDRYLSSIGVSYDFENFIIEDTTTRFISRAGSLKKYEREQEITMRIDWQGSRVKLYINDVLLCETKSFTPKAIPIHLRITSEDEVLIYDVNLQSIRPKLFVVMQFTEEYNKLYEEVILPISQSLGFDCIRADEFYTSTPILKDIISSIEESTAIIAEITPDNPNVFYEIGYAHAIKKPTILLCDKRREKLPFDISGFRTLFYENSIGGKSKIEKSLIKYLESI